MNKVFVGLGANLGSPADQLSVAVRALARHHALGLTEISSLYQSVPVDVPNEQPDYFNAVVGLETSLTPRELLLLGLDLEKKSGSMPEKFKAPRRLDIDWLLYNEDVVDESGLKIPHPAMTRRAFVLVPLAEIAPLFRHPLFGKTIAALRDGIAIDGVKQISRGSTWCHTDKE
ncbi:2-amino-4-hydroxy-6-hydroxymethyldihydropteridine diphosphokinase [bacterium]|nr:2-amino-4-hydroxy-6-hydroxymethyldihydropteridine diphosphokinase [bacterium]